MLLSLGAAPVMWLMIALSVFSVAIMLERAWFFRGISGDVAKLSQELATCLRRGDAAGAERVLEASRSVEASVVLAGLREAELGPRAAREAMASAALRARKGLERRLAYLGTLGSNAPFVGLFGTVIGIVMAFDELGAAGATNAGAGVMASIAEALVATAIGLAVAIPRSPRSTGFSAASRPSSTTSTRSATCC
ncbi:MAG: MotA/TolQ/ExbB proton channel family protein [Sandaracinus sp.]|nr:MotA/TolQ/ExbB proton channel family protein [Sandaracinus sp.]